MFPMLKKGSTENVRLIQYLYEMKPFIQDTERVLNSTNDLLKTSTYAENLVKVIENTPKDKVFTIGVFGGWGTGKSTIIRTAQKSIESSRRDVKFITYDAWKYANDSFRRMFLLKIQQELKMPQTEAMSRFYQSETSETEPRMILNAKRLAIAVAVLAIVSMALFLIPGVTIQWQVAIPTIGTLGAFFLALINGCFYDLKISFSKPALFAPEQFEDCFKEMMSKCLKRKNWFEKAWSAVKDYVEIGEASIVGLDKLVIVIDNIDRCPSDMAYQLLTDIKTFLSNSDYNLVFIVPVDDDALKKHLFRRWNKGTEEDYNKEKEEFLRKFFNVSLRIKPHQTAELQHFAHKIDEENHLGFSNDTLAIVAKQFADNPRRIIQLLNNLSGEIALYDDGFVRKYEPTICAALILREEYPGFYKTATKDLDILVNPQAWEEIMKTFSPTTRESFNGFMRIAGAIFRQTPLDAKQRIFTNTLSIFSDLPSDIQESVRSFDADKVIFFSDANEALRSDLVDYTLDRLKTDVRYQASSQILAWADFLCKLYVSSVFDGSRFAEIDEHLSPFYKDILPVTSDPKALCLLGSRMCFAGITSMRDSIIEFMKKEDAFSQSNFGGVLDGYLSYFLDEDDCEKVRPVVKDYFVEHPIKQEKSYTDVQIKLLFDEDFLAKQIDYLSAMDDEATLGNIIWCLETNKHLSKDIYNSLLGKCSTLFGNTRGKSLKQYLEFIQQLQPIFDAIATRALGDADGIYHVIIDERGMPHSHPAYKNNPQNDSHVSILDQIEDEESAELIVSFCFEILRISGGRTDVSKSINKLYSKNKRAVIDGTLRIHELGISIAPIANTLSQTTDYQSENALTILGIILSPQNDGSMMLADDVIKTKVRSLVDNSSNSGVATLLKKLASNDNILSLIAEYVITLDSKTVNALPSWIAKYAVGTFNRENAESFKDNPSFLILVLQHGNASQKKLVVRLMRAKIVNENDIENVVLVLNNLVTEDQALLKPLISDLDSIKDSEVIDDDTKTEVASLSAKLSASLKSNKLVGRFLGKTKKALSGKTDS